MSARRFSLALLLAVACAPRAPARAPAEPAAAPPPADTIGATSDTLRSYRIPDFHDGPLVRWGPLPPGSRHAERERSYDLQHQIIRVRFDWERRAVIGSTTIRVAALPRAEPVSRVALDAVDMSIRRVTNGAGRALRHDYDGRTLVVHLTSPLSVRSGATLTVDYETVRPKQGAYFIDRRHVVWTQGAAEDTRYWVPTYDYPNDKATWEVFVRTGPHEKALSNGRLVGSRRVGEQIEWHWRLAQPASTYLMSVVIGDYLVLQDVWRQVPLGYWVYPDSVAAGWRGFAETPLMVDLFTARSGVAYPWPKYDQSVVPDFTFGGMENVTATTLADDRVLHPAWAESHANSEDLVAHELAHQWYGNLLTTRDWSHLWLNEGFANFFEVIWREERDGPDAGALKRLADQEAAIAADLVARRPLVYDRWMTDPLELFAGGHIYTRGASVLQMLRRELGDSVFWLGMRRYTSAHRFANVTSDDLRRAFENASGRELGDFFRQWVAGAGYPVLRVSYAYDSLSRRLDVIAEQVQARDTLTGFFRIGADVEVLTDSGPVSLHVAMRDSVARASVALRAPPRAIRWDKGNWLLDVVDFPRPTVMLAYQLARADDALGRIEAASLLAGRKGEPIAVAALARALRDEPFWGVRTRVAAALGAHADDTAASGALIAATRDPDARVRESAAGALGGFAGAGVTMRLGELVDEDPSRFVRRAAVRSLAATAPESALPVIRRMLGRESWRDLERIAAMEALEAITAPEAWRLASAFLGDSWPRATRVAAIGALAARAGGREYESAQILAPLLDAGDPFVRIAAAQALGRVGHTSAIAALERRLDEESERRVVTAIEGALAALR